MSCSDTAVKLDLRESSFLWCISVIQQGAVVFQRGNVRFMVSRKVRKVREVAGYSPFANMADFA